MKAAVVTELGRPLSVREVPVPEPGPGQVLVRIEASGLCHTDIHAAEGDWPVKPTPPFIPGHEGVGIIERLGEGVQARQVGDRVALPWLGHACGSCRYCVTGWENLCQSQQNTGYSINGGLAEYAVADARFAALVPESVSAVDAAPLTCAGVTTYKAAKVAGIRPSETVLVSGIGGLGHLAIQYARLMGAIVVAVDIEDSKLELARDLGADHVVNAATEDPVKAVADFGGVDVAIALAADAAAFDQAFGSLRPGGRLVCVGLPAAGEMRIPIFETVLGGKSVIGSIVGTREDLAEVFRLHAAGRTRVVTEVRKLDQINQTIADVLKGGVPARTVFTF